MKSNREDELSLASIRTNASKFKIVFVGDQGVGKSSIINRYTKNQFDENYNSTVGIDFISKKLNVAGRAVRLQLWDTAGQEKFRCLIPTYLKDCDAAFVVYDITSKSRSSFESIRNWIDFVRESTKSQVMIRIVGNKSDLEYEREIPLSECLENIKDENVDASEISAKNGNNLNEVFEDLCCDLLHIPRQSLKQTNEQSDIPIAEQSKVSLNTAENQNTTNHNEGATSSSPNRKLGQNKANQPKQKSCCA